MKNLVKAKEFNKSFYKSAKTGRYNNSFGLALLSMATNHVNIKLGRRPEEIKEAIVSDVCLELLQVYSRVTKKNKINSVKNPYSYFKTSTMMIVADILRDRFSKARTRDHLGQKITFRTDSGEIKVAEFKSIEDYYELI